MYKNFNLTESEKKEILNMHKSHGYKKPLNEGMGMIWLTKIKIDSPKELTDQEKVAMTNKFQNSYNGRIAVEFGPNEWYDYNGRIEDIQAYEEHINNDVYGEFRKSPNAASFEKEVRQSRRDPNLEEPYDSKFTSYDDYQDKSRKELAARLRDFNTRRENGELDENNIAATTSPNINKAVGMNIRLFHDLEETKPAVSGPIVSVKDANNGSIAFKVKGNPTTIYFACHNEPDLTFMTGIRNQFFKGKQSFIQLNKIFCQG